MFLDRLQKGCKTEHIKTKWGEQNYVKMRPICKWLQKKFTLERLCMIPVVMAYSMSFFSVHTFAVIFASSNYFLRTLYKKL
jgi:hypothetical protein